MCFSAKFSHAVERVSEDNYEKRASYPGKTGPE